MFERVLMAVAIGSLAFSCGHGCLQDDPDYERIKAALEEGDESEDETESFEDIGPSGGLDDESFDPEGRNIPGEESELESETAEDEQPSTKLECSAKGCMYDWVMRGREPSHPTSGGPPGHKQQQFQ